MVKLKASGINALQVSTRAGTAAALSVVVAYALRLEFPLYALIAAIIVTDLSAARTQHLGLQRLLGTMIGAALGALISTVATHFTHVGPLMIGLGIFGAMLLSQAFGFKDAAKVSGYVCGIVLLTYHEHPWSYAFYRLVETLIGIAAAMAVSVVPKLLKIQEQPEG